MKKFIYHKICILITVCLIGFTSCGDSILEIQDPGSLTASTFPSSASDINLLVASIYGSMHNWEFMGHYWAGYCIYNLDHTVDQAWHGDPSWIDIHCGTVKVGNSKVENPWRALAHGVYYANVTLEAIEAFRDKAIESEISLLNQYEGEALFLRAYYWWHMLTLYGRPELDGVGIPIIKTVPKKMEEMQVAREKTGDCYQAIIEDWARASELLKEQTDNHRATEWSAKSALAKAYFFVGDNENAKKYLKDCIDNSGKKLVSFEEYKMMFNGDTRYEYNTESFFEMGNMGDPQTGGSYGDRSTGSAMSILYAHNVIKPDSARQSTSYANQYAHDKNLLRFGYNDPAVLSKVVTTNVAGGKKRSLDPAYVQQQLDRRSNAGREVGGPDPRLWVGTMQPFFDSAQWRWNGEMIYVKIAQGEPSGKWWEMNPTTGNDPNTWHGWPTRKYQFLGGHLGDQTRNCAGYNFYFIRLPDVYLMYAEIMKNEGNESEALKYINMVHRRAYNYDPESTSPVDYTSLTDRTITIDPLDPLANDPLLYERWAELYGEFRWWEDVRRLRMGQKEAAYYVNVHGPEDKMTPITWRDVHYAMPIPVIEFEANPNPGMIQTPGYN